MTGQIKPAGYCDLKEVKIYPYDTTETKGLDFLKLQGGLELFPVINNIVIEESMSSAGIYGNLRVFDALNILNKLPIRGEEFLKITYVDFFDVERTDLFFVYAVTDISAEGETTHDQSVMSYTLHFVSLQKFFSTNSTISKAYRDGNIADYVREIFDQYFVADYVPSDTKWTGKPKELSQDMPTIDAGTKFIVPDYSPEQAIHFFTRRAYSVDDLYNSFRFFENRDEYMFTNYKKLYEVKLKKLEEMRGQKKGLFYVQNYGGNIDPSRQEDLMHEVISVEYGNRADTLDDGGEGAYYKQTVEMDYLNHSLIYTEHLFHDDFGINDETSRLQLLASTSFINERLNDSVKDWVLKDYYIQGAKVPLTPDGYSLKGEFDTRPPNLGMRENTCYPELYNNKKQYMHHLGKNELTITVYGRNDVVAGDVITVQIPEKIAAHENITHDKLVSGTYFVDSIVNNIQNTTFTQKLTLVKSGINKAYGDVGEVL